MDERAALLKHIRAEPGCDTHRLVFADWLDEHGEPERAEFIRDCCLTLARHTDCPVRLADLKNGRPVPLRCGACEYCVARRRAERFYYRHQWLSGLPYAVAFEPTPLDGHMPTGPGLTLVVRRGFASEVRCPLELFTTHAAELFSRLPLTAVVLTDREPYEFGGGTGLPSDVGAGCRHFWQWWGREPATRPHRLPRDLMNCLYQLAPKNRRWHRASERTTNVYFGTRGEAVAALSAGAVRRGRELAGLPSLPPAAA